MRRSVCSNAGQTSFWQDTKSRLAKTNRDKNRFRATSIQQITLFFLLIVQMSDRVTLLTSEKAENFMATALPLAASKRMNLAVKSFGAEAKFILEQLHLREKALAKLPDLMQQNWLLTTKSYEQCTAEAVARFKADLMAAPLFTDLTAGAGVDAYYVSLHAERLQLVEAEDAHAVLLRHNFRKQLKVQVWAGRAEDVLSELQDGGIAYLDPDRRPGGQRVYDFSASRPDVLALLPALRAKFDQLWIKASPMSDVTACLLQLGSVAHVYAICWQDEVKELLFHLRPTVGPEPLLEAVLLGKTGALAHRFSATKSSQAAPALAYPAAGQFLLEPHAGITKLRLDKALAVELGLQAINPHAAYFLLPYWLPDFPGRQFRIEAVLPYKPKKLQAYFKARGIARVQMAKRDFFLEVSAIRKVLKMADGDDARLFFTKDPHGEGICIVCASQKL